MSVAAGPVSQATPITHQSPLPSSVGLLVIGGGVAGVSAALYAAREGASVLLLEKGRIAGEQSSRNWGWIRQQGRDPAELSMAIEAGHLWKELARATNDEIGLRQTGTLYLMRSEADRARYEDWMMHAEAHNLDTRILSKTELQSMMPAARAAWIGGLWTPSDQRAEPWLAVPALARLAAREGVAIREHCAVRCLDIAAGRVRGVMTEAGPVQAEAVILAGGAWSRLLLRHHRVDLPQLSVRASVMATGPLPEVFDGGAADGDLAFRRREDGGYSLAASDWHTLWVGPDAVRSLGAYWPQIRKGTPSTTYRPSAPDGFPDAWTTPRQLAGDRPGPFERMRVLDPPPDRAKLAEVARRFAAAFPAVGAVTTACAWAGMIDVLPDELPVIDALPTLEGLTVLTGLSGHGFGIGPAAGKTAARLALGQDPGHDLAAFEHTRFSRSGHRPRPGPHI